MILKNKVAIITGASRGIGKGIALALAKEGCNIVACARNEEQLLKLKEEVEAFGIQCEIVQSDIRVINNIKYVIEIVIRKFGKVDILINNAGVIIKDGIFGVTEKDWDLTMDTNLKAQFFLSQCALKEMKKNKEGHIINISSTVALGAKPEVTSYSVSKYAIVGLSEALYQEAKKYLVKVSTIYPGVTDTEMLRSQDMPCDSDQWMLPEDIAECVVFLLKTSSRMVVKDIVPWATGYDQI
jgi:3-oxoacyl-[acyl-carrier protein] reductase